MKRRVKSRQKGASESRWRLSKQDTAMLARLSRGIAETGRMALAETMKGFAGARLDPRWKEMMRSHSIPELMEMVAHGSKIKRGRGRPAVPNLDEILTAAAEAKATRGKYTQIAARFGLTAKQLTDKTRTHRRRFQEKLAEFTSNKLPS